MELTFCFSFLICLQLTSFLYFLLEHLFFDYKFRRLLLLSLRIFHYFVLGFLNHLSLLILFQYQLVHPLFFLLNVLTKLILTSLKQFNLIIAFGSNLFNFFFLFLGKILDFRHLFVGFCFFHFAFFILFLKSYLLRLLFIFWLYTFLQFGYHFFILLLLLHHRQNGVFSCLL